MQGNASLREMAALLRPFAPLIALSVVCGLAAGMGTVALLAAINHALNTPGSLVSGMLLAFAGLCGLTLIGAATSDITTNIVGQKLVAEVRKSLALKILRAPIDALEQYRTHRLIPVLTHDVDMISDVAFYSASLAIACAVTIGCLAYLAWLSPLMFAGVLLFLGIGVAVQYVARSRGLAGFWKARDGEEELHKAYRAIAEGAKELRMNRLHRAHIFDRRIVRTIEDIRAMNTQSIVIFVAANAVGSGLFFSAVALVLCAAAWSANLDQAVLSGFVLVLIFMKGPVDQIMSVLPPIVRAQIAFRRIADLSARFNSPEPHLAVNADGAGAPRRIASLGMRGVSYAFPASEGVQPFQFGPIDLDIAAGEMVFIVGDNGSGKTTLIKLLLGLYAPQRGEVLLDGAPLGPERRDDYRQLFTTVFADYYLFEDVASGTPVTMEEAAPYLERLEIAHKVKVENGAFTTTDLSTGQRKRLALVQAYLQERPVMVFDEWAADQDPAFRRIFYTELLPELKRQGRILIVISHDDRYFHLADRIVRLKDGRIAGGNPAEGAEAAIPLRLD
jgi:putative pyoverdin transport system ATP-binding/permease protein